MKRLFKRRFFAFSSTIMLITTLFSTVSGAKTIDITNITEPIVAQDGDILTGRRTLEAKISIADGATVTLQNFTHYEAYTTNIKPEPGITCEGNATIILKSENVIEGTKEYPGIYVPENKTLTIQGTGSLAASSQIAPAIGGDTTSVSGDIIIKGGSISAKGGLYSAAIGSYKSNPCGNITISGSRIIATKGREATYTIGAETSGKITIGGIETGVIKTRQYVYPLRAVHGTFNLSNTTDYAGYQLTDGVTLTGKLETNAYISIADGATVTIKDVSINNEKNSLFRWPGITCEGDATILIDGKDTIHGGDYHAGIFIPENKTLTFKGNGNLSVYSGSNAAGIGGEDYIPGGNVTILEGTIKAQAGITGGVGIGSGSHAEFGKITIKGGIILAKGNSAAIGAAYGGSYEDISITGGEVYALGGDYAPSIGTLSKGGNISIEKNATVFAFMNDVNPYINIKAGSKFIVDGVEKGTIKEHIFVYPIHTINDTLDLSKVTKAAGYQLTDGAVLTGKLNTNAYITIADGANITLKNATINRQANEFYNWAGITCEGDATINLNGQNSVRPFFGNAGIFVPENKTLAINGQGELNAKGYSGAAIGGTSYRKSGNIVINGGTINATGSGGAGIGCGGYGGKVFCGDITINGGTITATSNDAAGIGCSISATCGNITINGGTIVATGGLNYAGIGCGGAFEANVCGDISINGGSVTASKGKGANSSIGRGNTKSTIGKITIGGVETEDIEASPYTVSYYAITFDANGGTGKTMNNILFIDSENQKLTPNTFTREDCTFNDWNTKADGSGEKYKDGQAVSSSGKEPTTVYLYAQWIKLISSKDISIEIEPQIYTGKKICPDAIVYDIEKTLVKDIDYTVECSNNIKIGNASITFTGIGNYSGKVTKAFEISDDHIITNIADNFNTHIHMNWDKQTYDLKGRNITNKSKAKGSYYSKQR